ncbi:MAG: RnfABCDGE type electron transport complex subunit G [Halothermotrichaceae bacterium]
MKRLIITLTVLGLISALVLSSVYQWTKPKIDQHEREKQKKAIMTVLQESDDYNEVKKEGKVFFEGNRLGEIAYEISGAGYSGQIKMMIGFIPAEDKITAIQILNHSETPGLGANIETNNFRSNFKDKKFGEYQVVKRKVENPSRSLDVEAISGATISSKSVTRLVEKAVEDVQKYYGGEG